MLKRGENHHHYKVATLLSAAGSTGDVRNTPSVPERLLSLEKSGIRGAITP